MRINLKIPDELNKRRKSLKATWREVIAAGMKTLEKNPPIDIKILEKHMKKSVLHLKEAWESLRKTNNLLITLMKYDI